jgi:hemerythrin superfamily protein
MAQQEFTDGIMLLKNDHREVEELFSKFEKASGAERKQQLAEQICTELKIHTMLEEEIFYPALRGQIEDDVLDEAYVEHDGAKVLINDIMAGSSDEDFYVDLVALRDQMMTRKQELMQQAETAGLPPAQPAVVNPQPA